MTALALITLRKTRGWSQEEAARRLRVSQPYLSLLESGARQVSPRLSRRLLKVYGAPPTVLPLPDALEAWPACTNEVFVRHLSALGYPPFGYVEPHPKPENPAALLVWALGSDTLEPRLFEGLPWILLAFADLDVGWLVREAKLRDLQNRLGFVVYLACEVARGPVFAERAQPLATLLATLEPSRLAREDSSLGGLPSTPKIRESLRALRSPAAAHWNLLTLLKPEHLQYD